MAAEQERETAGESDGEKAGRPAGRKGRQDSLPSLGDKLFSERLDGPPPEPPKASETPHDKARRELIAAPGQWMVLNARVKLNEASARRLARSYARAKPARLVASAAGRFTARPFTRDGSWHVAAVYQPPGSSESGDDEPSTPRPASTT
jgi:hypothetical protein